MKNTQFFDKPHTQLSIVLLLFVMAFAARMYHITYPPHDFAAERQYQSAHITRGMLFEGQESIPEWRRNIAEINKKRMGLVLEPRIMENATLFFYRIIGKERFWIPRTLSSIFWLLGGVALYLIARKIASSEAALFTIVFYLFLPFSILASRSFQPDPLMVSLLLWSVWGVMRYYEQPSYLTLVSAVIISVFAILVKPYSIFFIFGAFTSIGIYKNGIKGTLLNKNFYLFSGLSGSLALSYYVYGVLASMGFLNELAQGWFLPHLLVKPYFWKDWFLIIGQVIGYIPFAVAIIGLIMAKGHLKALLLGLWASYLIFGITFTQAIHTHDYYHLPFIPVAALSIGLPGAMLVKYLLKQWKVTVITILIIASISGVIMLRLNLGEFFNENKDALKTATNFIGINTQFKKYLIGDFEREVEMAKEIGEIVGHSTNNLFLTHNFGRVIAYNGEFSGLSWPTSFSLRDRRERGLVPLEKEELFNPRYLTIRTHGKYIKYTPDFFIITEFSEFEEQVDLREFLNTNFPVIAQTEDYIIFDLRKMSRNSNPSLIEETSFLPLNKWAIRFGHPDDTDISNKYTGAGGSIWLTKVQ